MADSALDVTAALVRGASLVSDLCARVAEEHALTVQQAQLLCMIAPQPAPMAWIADNMRISRSSVTGLIDRASEADLVYRSIDTSDRRYQLVHLTPRGDQLGRSYRSSVTSRMAQLLDVIDDTSIGHLREAMEQLVLAHQARPTWPRPVSAA